MNSLLIRHLSLEKFVLENAVQKRSSDMLDKS
jgi:hypothetical protein